MNKGENRATTGHKQGRALEKHSITSATPPESSKKAFHHFGHSTQRGSDHASKQRTRTNCPHGSGSPRPSPVDPSIELQAEFLTEMVIEMQGAAAKKARKTVIGRTLGGRASFKALHECLKLHLPTSFASTTLLTRGYFLILFDSEEGAIATRKLTTVD